MLSGEVGVWLEKQNHKIDDHTDTEQAAGEQVQDTEQNPALVKFVDAPKAKEQA